MSFLLENIPYMKCLVRREYLHNLNSGTGDFVEGIAHAVRCVRGSSLWFQVALGSPFGGAHFLLPIQALVCKPCDEQPDMQFVQPWDVFSSTFCVVVLDFVQKGEAYVLPGRLPAQYQFTVDYTASDLADDMEQHKNLHILKLSNGLVGAFPNNRVLMPDAAFFPLMSGDMDPEFVSLDGEYRAEGNQRLINHCKSSSNASPPVVPAGAEKSLTSASRASVTIDE